MRSFPKAFRWFVTLAACLALAGAVACKKKDAATEAAKAPLKADVGSVAIPAPVMGFATAKSLDALTGAVGSIASKFNPGLGQMIGAQIPALLQGQLLGVKTLSWLDATKPVKVVVLDWKAFGKPLVVLLPHKGKDALLAALPDNKAAGAPDNETQYTSPNGTQAFLNVLDDYAAFSLDAKAFAAAKPFLSGDFQKYPATELLDVQVSSANLQATAAPELAKMKEEMASGMAQDPAMSLVPAMGDLLKKEVEMMMDVLKQTQVLRVVLKWDEKDLVLATSLKVNEGGGLAKFAADTQTRKAELFKTMPSDAWLLVGSNIDPKIFAGWTDLSFDFWTQALQMTPEETAKLKALSAEAMALQTGDTAVYMGRDGEFPLRVLSATAVTDGDKARAAVYALYTLLLQKAGVAIEKNAGPELKGLPKLDWTSLTTLVAGLQPVLGATGITLAVKERAEGDLKADVMEMVVDYAKVPGAADAEEIQKVAKMIGNKVDGALAFDKGRMYFGFGKDSVKDLAALAKAQPAAGNALTPVIDKAGHAVSMAGWLSLVDLLKVVAMFEESVAMTFPGLAAAKPDAGVTFVLGGHGNGTIDASLGIPVARLADLMPKAGAEPAPANAPLAPAPAPQAP